MSDCRRARAIIQEVVRGKASEAERLLLDEHLAGCVRCREERAQWSLFERLRNEPAPQLGSDARARVLRHLRTLEPAAVRVGGRLGRSWQTVGVAAVVAGLLVVGIFGVPWNRRPTAGGENVAGPGEATALMLLQAERAGELVSLTGVKIAYAAGTTLRVPRRPQGRTVELLGGRADIEVTPGGPGHFQLRTSHFVVEVLGTRFIVTPDDVRTLHGTVRVLDLAGKVVAVIGAGEVWTRPEVEPSRVPEVVSPLPIPAAESTPAAAPPVAHHSPVGADHLLRQARALLGAGDGRHARGVLTELLARRPTARQTAMAELLTGDSYLIEGRRDVALPLYRRTAARYRGTAEGETAEFAAAEILVEQGARAEARQALELYLSWHPAGQFAREARDRLSTLSSP